MCCWHLWFCQQPHHAARRIGRNGAHRRAQRQLGHTQPGVNWILAALPGSTLRDAMHLFATLPLAPLVILLCVLLTRLSRNTVHPGRSCSDWSTTQTDTRSNYLHQIQKKTRGDTGACSPTRNKNVFEP